MIVLAKNRGIAVVLIAVPEFGLFLKPADDYAALADEHKVPIERDILSKILKQNRLKTDQIHPNAEGYQLFAQSIYALLVDYGAL